jgi:hypothetical protein
MPGGTGGQRLAGRERGRTRGPGLAGREWGRIGAMFGFIVALNAAANFNINTAGFCIVGLFVAVWAAALAYWRFARVRGGGQVIHSSTRPGWDRLGCVHQVR